VIVATVLGVGAVAMVATPAHAEPDVVETTLSVTADPGPPGTAVLHAEMVGSYVSAGGRIPAGTWSFMVADDSGATLFTTEVARPDSGPTSVDVVWADAPPGISASGIVAYLPSESSDLIEFVGATAAFRTEGTAADATDARLTSAAPKPLSADSGSATGLLTILAAASLVAAAIGILLLVRRNRPGAGDRA
jgi:hypothetical protein